ncbi:hypothetical protein EVJ58_g10859 [Rhodofomes roseus]|uniref:Uncharacterized protein n=1 Tax=Rhodofomes roseus TaxID=34475 RepID=A0A4Y9XM85_9APHY|nr:hypothetical protein EVJ58_g10859 [Rhodofomes roseus]
MADERLLRAQYRLHVPGIRTVTGSGQGLPAHSSVYPLAPRACDFTHACPHAYALLARAIVRVLARSPAIRRSPRPA